jgi:hypothetical protein
MKENPRMVVVGWSRMLGRVCAAVIIGGLISGRAGAAPQIEALSLRGLQIGGTTTIAIAGSGLLPAPRLLTALPIESQMLKPGATASHIELDVTVRRGARPGFYQLRLANTGGISGAVVVGVDDLPQLPFTAAIPKLPAALHGTVSGDATAITSFSGRKSQHIVVEVEARRLGSAIDPQLELQDARGVPLAWSPSKALLADDARLEAVLPADGRYSVLLRDALYRAGTPNQFRLKIGDLHYADHVFPLGVQRGTRATLQLLGRVPGDGKVTFDANTDLDEVPVPLPPVHAFIGKAPAVLVSDYPELSETPQALAKVQEFTAPAAVSGRIGRPGEEDRYRLRVQPGLRLRVEVYANRIASPLDGVLSVRNEAGASLAAADDQSDSVDPGLDFTVPAGVNAVIVAVADQQGRGGSDFVYRLAVTPRDQADFRLTVFEDRLGVPQNGAAVIRVRAERAGYRGPIRLSLPELPRGIAVSSAEIPAGQTDTLLTLTAPPGQPLTELLTSLVGENTVGPKRHRQALAPSAAAARQQPWMRGELALAVVAADPIRLRLNAPTTITAGDTSSATVTATQSAGASGPVRLSLLTSQVVPRTKDGKQEDQSRALRLDGRPMIAAGQTSTALRIVVPGDLPAASYDLAVRAELLSSDGRTVLATAVSPSRRVQVQKPKPAVAKQP